MYGLWVMENFIKQYSYNQIIEQHDVLIMSLEQFKQSKDQLVNPKVIVCVDREGGIKEPKIPKWFQSYKKETDSRFEKIEVRLENIENKLDDSKTPKWFTDYMEEFAKNINLRFEKLENKLDNVIKLNNLKTE